jgi:hypothetical protein
MNLVSAVCRPVGHKNATSTPSLPSVTITSMTEVTHLFEFIAAHKQHSKHLKANSICRKNTYICIVQNKKYIKNSLSQYLIVREYKGWVRNVALIKCTLGPGKPNKGWNFGREGTGGQMGNKGS